MHEHVERLKAAYALNLCTVSVAQIIDYNDINILEQEYENILYNLNLEQLPKDEALEYILREILDTITYLKISEGDKKLIDAEYQHKMKNAVWSAIPNIGGIFVRNEPVTIGLTLATQIGIGYMNYRRNRAEYQLVREREYWQLKRSAIDQLNGLQKELFSTALRLAREYNFPDKYRLTERQIHEYNEILMEQNAIKRYNRLDAVRDQFSAYPHFWYQIGSTANSIYRSNTFGLNDEVKAKYKTYAIECFERYKELNQFNILRHDILTSAWALEYIDILDVNNQQEKKQAQELVVIAERHAGNAKDVLELCAYAYLKLGDYDAAARIFKTLVNADYNADINAKILSGIYISKSRNIGTREEAIAEYQMLSLITNPSYLLPMPKPGEDWHPEWESNNAWCENSSAGVSDFEEITISKIVHIPPNETKKYKNKVIHLQSFINCEGTLEFDTCVIHYGEDAYVGAIKLGQNASITMRQCTIENHSYSKQYLIDASSKNTVKISNCELVNCGYFVDTNGALTMDGCQVICPGKNFISAYYADSVVVTGCKFNLQDKPVFYPDPDKIQDHIISAKKINFAESEVEGSYTLSETKDAKELAEQEKYNFLCASYATIKNTSFSKCTSLVSNAPWEVGLWGEIDISLCTFDGCYSCVKSDIFSGIVKIEDCVFNRCSRIATDLKKGSQITNSQFNDCFYQLITTGYDGGLTLAFCEFNNWRSDKSKNSTDASLGWSDPSMLLFDRNRKDGQCSIVEHCIFNGVAAHQGFLIKGLFFGKVKGMVVSVADCSFLNCTTDRKSGKLIKEYAYYFGRFNAKKEQRVVSVSNCQGLDRVNKEGRTNQEVMVKSRTSTGALIGVGAAVAIAGVPGYVVASAIKRAATDDDIHVE